MNGPENTFMLDTGSLVTIMTLDTEKLEPNEKTNGNQENQNVILRKILRKSLGKHTTRKQQTEDAFTDYQKIVLH